MFKKNLILFIDELILQFENNCNVLNRLIRLHHTINNKLEENELIYNTKKLVNDDLREKIKNKNPNIFSATEYIFIFDLMTKFNQEIIWKWLNLLLVHLDNE